MTDSHSALHIINPKVYQIQVNLRYNNIIKKLYNSRVQKVTVLSKEVKFEGVLHIPVIEGFK